MDIACRQAGRLVSKAVRKGIGVAAFEVEYRKLVQEARMADIAAVPFIVQLCVLLVVVTILSAAQVQDVIGLVSRRQGLVEESKHIDKVRILYALVSISPLCNSCLQGIKAAWALYISVNAWKDSRRMQEMR